MLPLPSHCIRLVCICRQQQAPCSLPVHQPLLLLLPLHALTLELLAGSQE
jgi:hypothetical protein